MILDSFGSSRKYLVPDFDAPVVSLAACFDIFILLFRILPDTPVKKARVTDVRVCFDFSIAIGSWSASQKRLSTAPVNRLPRTPVKEKGKSRIIQGSDSVRRAGDIGIDMCAGN